MGCHVLDEGMLDRILSQPTGAGESPAGLAEASSGVGKGLRAALRDSPQERGPFIPQLQGTGSFQHVSELGGAARAPERRAAQLTPRRHLCVTLSRGPS